MKATDLMIVHFYPDDFNNGQHEQINRGFSSSAGKVEIPNRDEQMKVCFYIDFYSMTWIVLKSRLFADLQRDGRISLIISVLNRGEGKSRANVRPKLTVTFNLK